MSYSAGRTDKKNSLYLAVVYLLLIGLLFAPSVLFGGDDSGELPNLDPPPEEEGTPPDTTTTAPDMDGTSQIDIILLEAVLSLSL